MERFTRLAPSSTVSSDTGTRTVDYIFSDESVGRDGHIVKNNAWRLDNFNANPVFLWAHLDTEPPVGRVFNLRVAGGAFRGSVRYAETDFADSIYQLVRGKFLNAVSTSWQPIEYDRMPAGKGLIFTDVDLIEVSQVPCPALPTALATARSHVNLTPVYEWAARALDTGRLGSLNRPLVEAVCRAARPSSTRSSMSDTDTVEGRLRRARALQAKGRAMSAAEDQARHDRYRRLRDEFGFSLESAAGDLGIAPEVLRGSVARTLASGESMATVVPFERKVSGADRTSLRQASRHLAKAQRHHSALEDYHTTMEEHIRTASAAHRKLTKTLTALGESSARTTSTLAGLGYGEVSRAMEDMGAALAALRDLHGEADDAAGSAQQNVKQAGGCLDGMIASGTEH